jgi:mono/diheme cytochrome c family protein
MRYASLILGSMLFLSFSMWACQSTPKGTKGESRKKNPKNDKGDQSADLAWDNHFQTYFDRSCKSCHGNGMGNYPVFETYDDVKQNSTAILGSVKGGRMPKGSPENSDTISKLEIWMNSGMPKTANNGQWGDNGGNNGGNNGWNNQDTSQQKLTYENGIKQLVQNSCVTCHGQGGTYPDLSTFEKLKFSAQRSLEFIENGQMPKPPTIMAAEDKSKFREWYQGGMLEKDLTGTNGSNNSGNNSNTGQGSVTYQAQVKPLIDRLCAPCHTSSSQFPNLGSQQSASQNANSMLSAIQNNSMPPNYANKTVTDQDKKLVQDWINGGSL